jgi:hypothetical protein
VGGVLGFGRHTENLSLACGGTNGCMRQSVGKHAHEYHLHVLDRRRRHHGADFRQVLHLCSENPFERIHARVVCAFVFVCVCVCVCIGAAQTDVCVCMLGRDAAEQCMQMPNAMHTGIYVHCIQACECIAYRHVIALHTGM